MAVGSLEVTQRVEELITSSGGNLDATRDELLAVTNERLMCLTRSIKRSFPSVGRWEQTEDIFQKSAMKLCRSLEEVEIEDARHFFRLAALKIRQELLDAARRVDGPHGLKRNHQTQPQVEEGEDRRQAFEAFETTGDPTSLAAWSDFHEAIGELPEKEREVVELLWYHGLKQKDAAALLGVADKTVQRLWLKAKLRLGEMLASDNSLVK